MSCQLLIWRVVQSLQAESQDAFFQIHIDKKASCALAAETALGLLSVFGNGASDNCTPGVSRWRTACDSSGSVAAFALAACYIRVKGAERDAGVAASLYRMTARAGQAGDMVS